MLFVLDREKCKVMIYIFKVICSKDYTSHSNSKGIPVPVLKKHKQLGHSVFPTTPKTREERERKKEILTVPPHLQYVKLKKRILGKIQKLTAF